MELIEWRGGTHKIPQVAEKCSFHCSPKQEHNNREIRRRRTREQERASFLHIRLDENCHHITPQIFKACCISKPSDRVNAERQINVLYELGHQISKGKQSSIPAASFFFSPLFVPLLFVSVVLFKHFFLTLHSVH